MAQLVCQVPGCNSTLKNSKLFNFPKDARCILWAQLINSPSLSKLPPSSLRRFKLCHKHFTPACFRDSTTRSLTVTAIPTLNLILPTPKSANSSNSLEISSSDSNLNASKTINKSSSDDSKNELVKCKSELSDVEAGPSSFLQSDDMPYQVEISLNDIETTTGAITEIPEVAAPPPPKKPRIRLDWKRKCSEKKPLLSLNSSKISASLQRLLNAKEKDEYVNFNDVCRACLSSKSDMTEIKDVTLGEMTAQEVFEKYISVTIEDEGNLPQQLCTTCLYELCRVYLFINNCQAADTKLRELTTKYNNYEDELYHSTIPVNKNSEVEPPIEIQNPRDPEALMNMGPLKVDEPGPPYVCNNCKEVFETLKQIKLHRKQNKHYRVRQYLCRFCNPSKVYSFIHWKSHMITHTGLKPYDCQTCGKKFSTHANRARHILIHTGVKPFSCDICLKAFTQKTQLTAHNLKAHNTDKSKGHFECDECGKVLSSKASLVHHKVVHSEKKFLCTHCGKSFHYQMQFNMHMDSHLGIRRYKCQSCDKAFTRPLSLVLHKRTHTGHKPYQCKYCDKRFAQKGHLVCHNRIHTGERPYSCPYCDKTFALNGNLTVHIRKHTGENPFVCDICNKGFADSSSMNKHRKKVHTKETNVVFNRDLGEVISVPIHYQERRNMPVISFE